MYHLSLLTCRRLYFSFVSNIFSSVLPLMFAKREYADMTHWLSGPNTNGFFFVYLDTVEILPALIECFSIAATTIKNSCVKLRNAARVVSVLLFALK